jgi:hypothetical protein
MGYPVLYLERLLLMLVAVVDFLQERGAQVEAVTTIQVVLQILAVAVVLLLGQVAQEL